MEVQKSQLLDKGQEAMTKPTIDQHKEIYTDIEDHHNVLSLPFLAAKLSRAPL